MENKWLISICAGWQQKQSLLNAKYLGVKVIAFDADVNAPCKSLADLFFPIDICNPKAIIKKIEQLEITPIVAVSFISDLGMRSAGIINDYFKTGGMSEELANKLTNKKLQRICWDSLGVFNPKWACVKVLSFPEIKSLFNQFTEEVVMIKPIDSAGSRGVFKINKLSVNDIPLLKEALEFSIEREIIIEEYINGREFSIESFWNNGNCEVLAISERIVLHDKTASTIISTTLPYEIEKIIVDATIKANSALGVQFGLTHTELILDKENNPFLLETAGRGGGFYVFDELVRKVTGVDYSKVYIEQLMKQKPSNHVIGKKKAAAIKYLPSRLGIIKSISGFNEANKIEGVKAECFVQKGDSTNFCVSDADRIGYILVWGKSRKELDYLFMKASSLIEISYY
jgi:biotin carboxylase